MGSRRCLLRSPVNAVRSVIPCCYLQQCDAAIFEVCALGVALLSQALNNMRLCAFGVCLLLHPCNRCDHGFAGLVGISTRHSQRCPWLVCDRSYLAAYLSALMVLAIMLMLFHELGPCGAGLLTSQPVIASSRRLLRSASSVKQISKRSVGETTRVRKPNLFSMSPDAPANI